MRLRKLLTREPVRWPVSVSGGKVVSVEGLLGYSGAAYDGGGEFDFFKANWGLRKL